MQYKFRNRNSVQRALHLLLCAALLIYASAAYSASKSVLVLGDSLSAEYGLTRGSGWVPLLIERIKQEKITATVINASISGETTSGGRTRLPELLQKHDPDIVIIELGANDGLRGLPISMAEKNLRAMVDAARQSKAQVLLVGMQIPPNYGADYTRKFSAMYAELAKRYKTSLVPFMLEGIAEKTEMFQADRIHPTSEAQVHILNNIWPHLKPLLVK